MSYPPDGFDSWPIEERNKHFAAEYKRLSLNGGKERPVSSLDEPFQKASEAPAHGGWTGTLDKTSGMTPRSIRWLWKDWLAAEKFHILAGVPGTGKTTIAMRIAATISAGGKWPDGTQATAQNVVIWSGEDDPADTLVPRLAASGADLNRVYFPGQMTLDGQRRPFDPAQDLGDLRAMIGRIGGCGLLILDPIVSASTGDSHKNGETRRGLQPAVDLAAELGAGFLGFRIFLKERKAGRRLIASAAHWPLGRWRASCWSRQPKRPRP